MLMVLVIMDGYGYPIRMAVFQFFLLVIQIQVIHNMLVMYQFQVIVIFLYHGEETHLLTLWAGRIALIF